jgi:hypothetical protein
LNIFSPVTITSRLTVHYSQIAATAKVFSYSSCRYHRIKIGLPLKEVLIIATELVAHTGFEPVISSLRGRCPRPLDECATRSSFIIAFYWCSCKLCKSKPQFCTSPHLLTSKVLTPSVISNFGQALYPLVLNQQQIINFGVMRYLAGTVSTGSQFAARETGTLIAEVEPLLIDATIIGLTDLLSHHTDTSLLSPTSWAHTSFNRQPKPDSKLFS